MTSNPYQQTEVSTADRGKILLMLYDGAINFTKQAKVKLQEGDLAGKGIYITKAERIISEFLSTLDHKVHPELAGNLERLYFYMIDQLSYANLHKVTQPLDVVIRLLSILREGWGKVIEKKQAIPVRPNQPRPPVQPNQPPAMPNQQPAMPNQPLAMPNKPLAMPNKPLAMPNQPLAKPNQPLAKPNQPGSQTLRPGIKA